VAIASAGEFDEFDLNAFFEAVGTGAKAQFKHKSDVQKWLDITGLTVTDFHLLVRLKVFNTEQMNQAVFAFRRYEDASLCYTGIESHEGLRHYGLYDTVVARE
jgi:hypothetical protein